MKALCVIGSPRKKGNTNVLVDKIIEGFSINSNEIAKYFLNDMNINFCTGCYTCEEQGKCIQRDDMDILIPEIMKSDIIVMASPSYWADVTGQMKVFIDRCLPLCNAKTGKTPVPRGKLGIAVAVRAGSDSKENQHIIDTFEHFFGHLEIKSAGSVTAESVDVEGEVTSYPEVLSKAKDLGRIVSSMIE